ncbi:5-deoxy-glucuronate isomerase [Saccharothrix coeruleofusca]|uniref:5-deoxy-glucuronate isomerase n=2 Tax=Saccharothrix coeruleofusca TaxID=33919 RepID=A0A918AV40_9PSEU|nr:5-deoxy-glucuronate isomerase [Saccharothrix coeruleofusca]GGP81031.1 5-deoxy-glucuronate isomerase [Saccharothrix coeruleofusca]
MRLHRPLGTLADGADAVRLSPDDAGWARVGLRVLLLRPGVPRTIRTGVFEAFVLPLSGGCAVEVDGERFELAGRDSVFTRVTDFAYVPRDATVTLSAKDGAGGGAEDGAEVALPMARCERRLPARYGPAEGVPVEVRGAGNATRQVTNFGVPGAWDHADRLMACELITPDGNWSSYPPHKHDETCPVANEEVYYFRVAGRDGVTPSREGFALHRTYADDGAIDEDVVVRDGDVFLVPRGYHGPCVAAPGYPLYYLNVLAGSGAERSMAFRDDPAHSWVRDTWAGRAADPRCPVTTAGGRAG